MGLNKSIPVFISVLTDSGALSPAVATSLRALQIDDDGSCENVIIGKLATCQPLLVANIADRLAKDILLNVPRGSLERRSKPLLDATRALGILTTTLCELERAHQFVERDSPDRRATEDTPAALPDFSGKRFVTTAAIGDAVALATAQEGYIPILAVLRALKATVTAPADREPFLNAVAYVTLDDFADGYRAKFITEALAEWGHTPAIDRWRREDLPKVIVTHFKGFARWLKEGTDYISPLLDAASMSPEKLQQTLLEGVEQSGLTLRSRPLFGVANLLARTANSSDAQALMGWYLNRANRRLPPEALAFDLTDLPNELTGGIGRLLFTLMSDIDSRNRWRAAHATRRLAALAAQDEFMALFANYDRVEEKLYRAAGLYYFLAARLWSMLAAARAADESPSAASALLTKLLEIVSDNQLPHVLIRQYAKLAIETLVSHGVSISKTDAQKLRAVNTSQLRRVPARAPSTASGRREGWSDRRFQFDTMDITGKWYEPILEMFPTLPRVKLIETIEHWIVDVWKAPEKATWWDNEPRRPRLGQNFNMYHSRGELPIVERQGSYLQWHAMFCAVGEFLPRYPLKKVSTGHEFSYDHFEDWLISNLLTAPPLWQSDLRQPTPLRPTLWAKGSQKDEQWVARVSNKQFEQEFITRETDAAIYYSVYGDWTSSFDTREVDFDVSSALVSPENAEALALSIPYDYRSFGYFFPLEDSDRVINTQRYQLTGWLRSPEAASGFDERDPVAHHLRQRPVLPGLNFLQQTSKLISQSQPLQWISNTDGGVAIQSRLWSDSPETYDGEVGSHRRQTRSYGQIVEIRRDTLLHYLAERRMDLIVSVNILRRLENEYRSSHEEKKKTVVPKAFHH